MACGNRPSESRDPAVLRLGFRARSVRGTELHFGPGREPLACVQDALLSRKKNPPTPSGSCVDFRMRYAISLDGHEVTSGHCNGEQIRTYCVSEATLTDVHVVECNSPAIYFFRASLMQPIWLRNISNSCPVCLLSFAFEPYSDGPRGVIFHRNWDSGEPQRCCLTVTSSFEGYSVIAEVTKK